MHETHSSLPYSMDNKQIRNKRSGLALTFGNLAANVAGDQQDANGRETQRFEYASLFPLTLLKTLLSICTAPK